MSLRRESSAGSSHGSPYGVRRTSARSLGSLPPPPAGLTAQRSQSSSSYSDSIAKSMTIDEMRVLHDRALREAEAKRTELRLVLASRYRELVGSSDEVIRMNERSQELHDLVHGLPLLFEKLANTAISQPKEPVIVEEKDDEQLDEAVLVTQTRSDLFQLPRAIHRALDRNDVLEATTSLITLFTVIASCTDKYPLANSLADAMRKVVLKEDEQLKCQAQMTFLHVQSLPRKIQRTASRKLLVSGSYGNGVEDPHLGAYESATSLVSVDLLDADKKSNKASHLLDLYFDSKAKLLMSLLNRLQSPDGNQSSVDDASESDAVLAKIVLILQYDALLHPYQIFVLKKFPCQDDKLMRKITSILPSFDKAAVKAKCSSFMATHLPLIRKRVKSVLVTIAGTTASALGHIRQSLYDKTDGAQVMELLSQNGVCTWEQAVEDMIDIRTVFGTPDGSANYRFSLWNVLFSNTFSSLVHSLLTTSFQSVHTRLVATLRTSLQNAPPASCILPHEAYRNTLKLATDLDRSLIKVSDDAHELLIHAEERVESERRLKESLYVQACEILGRLVSELRRLVKRETSDSSGSVKELVVGRLCYLLKFRLSALPELLDYSSSPAAMKSKLGMISFVNLQSAFEISDDDEDGVISFDEGLQAVESAFSGTPFHGAEMVRETLLLSSKDEGTDALPDSPEDVTLDELVLLTARGLRHEPSGPESALGAFQRSLDKIVDYCFSVWAKTSLKDPSEYFVERSRELFEIGAQVDDNEWKRIFSKSQTESFGASKDTVQPITPFLGGYFIAASTILNCSTCPADSFQQSPSTVYSEKLGMVPPEGSMYPTMLTTLRWSILFEVLDTITKHLVTFEDLTIDESFCQTAIAQLHGDASFVLNTYFQQKRIKIGSLLSPEGGRGTDIHKQQLQTLVSSLAKALVAKTSPSDLDQLRKLMSDGQKGVLDSTDLYFASLFGDTDSSVSAAGEIVTSESSRQEPLIHMPLASSRRFNLLPVAADRTLNEIQLRGKYTKEADQPAKSQESASTNVVSSSFGFLSSMLNKR